MGIESGGTANFDLFVADVAELADALDSKSSIREDVWVRPPPSAPYKSTTFDHSGRFNRKALFCRPNSARLNAEGEPTFSISPHAKNSPLLHVNRNAVLPVAPASHS